MTDRRRARRPIPRRQIYSVAVVVSVIALAVLLMPGRERLRAAGPANTGHENLACAQCHTSADGTVRQQIQANTRFLLGLRSEGAPFIHNPVGNVDCMSCHQNDEDRHPVYRFEEARFAEVRAEIAPQYCVSCHSEHTGRRVTSPATVCSSCHTQMEIPSDPIEPTHATLAERGEWGTCMSCHDFHGNHVRTTPRWLADAPSEADVERYLAGGPPIYGTELRYPAELLRKAR